MERACALEYKQERHLEKKARKGKKQEKGTHLSPVHTVH